MLVNKRKTRISKKRIALRVFTAYLSVMAVGFLFSCAKHMTVNITDAPCLIPERRNHFKLCNDINVFIDSRLIVIPKDFQTDLASVPKILWPIHYPNDEWTIGPAILHDYLYACNHGYSRWEIDTIFYDAMVQNDTPRIKALKYYIGVRIFGQQFYKDEPCEWRLD